MAWSREQINNARICSDCEEMKPETEFYRDRRRGADRPRPKCKRCHLARSQVNQGQINARARERYKRIVDPEGVSEQQCRTCLQTKPLEAFYRDGRSKTGRQAHCAECTRANRKAFRAANGERINAQRREARDPAAARDAALRWKFGITSAEADEMLDRQSGCAICGTREPTGRGWHVDHDHSCCPGQGRTCGRCVRGILCHHCNLMIGQARDSIERLTSAADYLRRTSVVL